MINKLECTCIEAYKTRKMRDPNCCACSCDHNDLVEQLAKANERVRELEKQFETQMANDFVTITDQAKRITELEKYNLDLANESHSKNLEIDSANERIAELELPRKRNVELIRALFYAPSSPVSAAKAKEIEDWFIKFEQLRKEQNQ